MTGADSRFRFYDFFAGAGLATLGLRNLWQCVWANDIAPRKAAVYTASQQRLQSHGVVDVSCL
jgi:DNA (cytosine-5)-methyltransferase 1